MKKYAVLILILYSPVIFGQTLFTYGKYAVGKKEFLTAFRKNNQHVKATDKAYREYLDLYIRYRLKVQAAYDMKLDELPGQVTELQNFKSQIIEPYTNDESSLNQLAKEAYKRSKNDLKISYIWVAAPANAGPDTLAAWNKIQDAALELKKGKNFNETADRFSEDPFVKENHGNIGYVTVFDLPYDIESMAYKTPVGKISPVFRTPGGYVILKKEAERPAWGRIRIAQILLIYPVDGGEAGKKDTRRRADSIYNVLQSGGDFAALARNFSGDNLSFQLGGLLPEFGIGKYEPGFENTAYSLTKDGEISRPYASAFGYHIIRRMARIPVPSVPDKKTMDALKERIKSDPRSAVSKNLMLQTIIRQTGFRENIPAGNALWIFTDSALQDKKPAGNASLNEQTVLFYFPDKKYTVHDWIQFRKNIRSAAPQTINGKTNAEILRMYKQNVAFEYYRLHLERYNPEYAAQVAEFRDGNLLFEVMQKEIWNKASADSAGLRKYFEAHEKDYWWKPGAEAILVSAPDSATGIKLENAIKKNPSGWRRITDSLAPNMSVDSGRFEWKQIPGGKVVNAGAITEARIGNAYSFAYILRVYKDPAPRTFDEARGLVIGDYQNQLESTWIADLKKKYPVTINEKVFQTLPR